MKESLKHLHITPLCVIEVHHRVAGEEKSPHRSRVPDYEWHIQGRGDLAEATGKPVGALFDAIVQCGCERLQRCEARGHCKRVSGKSSRLIDRAGRSDA